MKRYARSVPGPFASVIAKKGIVSMEQLKKMVPVVAVGLAVAAMSSVDAYAAEEPAQPVDAAPPAEEVKQENPAPSTEINTAVAVQTPEGSEPLATSETPDTPGTSDPVTTPEETTGPTTTELVVNPGTDAEGNLTQDGTLTNTTTPGEKTEVTEPTGDPATTVTTNPDGSTTTTTTTPNQTTTTENSSSVITGEIKDNGAPSQEEIDKVQDGWAQLIQGVTPTEEPDGSKVYTIEQRKEEGKPLTADELAAVLGVTLTQVEGKENTYTYTTQDGETVTITTVTVTSDDSTETTTIRWTITVKENSEEKDYSYNFPVIPVTDVITDEATKNILDLAASEKPPFQTIEKDADSNITKVVDGNRTYEFKYDVKETPIDISGMTSKDIFDLLPKDLYVLDGNKILDNAGHELTLDVAQSKLIRKIVTITMTVTDSQGKESDTSTTTGSESTALLEAKKQAIINVVAQAIEKDGIPLPPGDEIKDHITFENLDQEQGTATAKVTSTDGKTYTYEVKANGTVDHGLAWTAQQIADKQTEHKKPNISSGFTTTANGNAFITGETVSWTVNKDGSGFINPDGTVAAELKHMLKGTDEQVEAITYNENGTIATVVTQKGNVTKTYTFRYENANFDDFRNLLSQLPSGTTLEGIDMDVTNLKKTTWTVEVKTTTTGITENVVSTIVPPNLTKEADGKYHYEEGGEIFLLEKDSGYTFTQTKDGITRTYTLFAEDVDLSNADFATIESYLGSEYTNIAVLENGDISATYDGMTVIIRAKKLQVITVRKTVVSDANVTLSQSGANSAAAKSALLEEIKSNVRQAEKNQKVYVTIDGKEYTLSIDESGNLVGSVDDSTSEKITEAELITWIEDHTTVNFEAMESQQLQKYLETLKENGTPSQYNHYHLDLLVGNSLKLEGSEDSEECVVLGEDLTVTVAKNAHDIVYGNGTARNARLEKDISYDSQKGGFYQYQRGEEQALSPGFIDHQLYEFYKVKGTVAYGLLTGEGYEDGCIYDITETITSPILGIPIQTVIKESAESRANAILNSLKETSPDATMVKFSGDGKTFYKVFRNTAPLEAYGYLDEASNACDWQRILGYWEPVRGYDLKLDNLTLLNNGKVTATGENIYSYSAELTTKTTETYDNLSSGSQLTVDLETSSTETTQESGHELTGSYGVTEKKNVGTGGYWIYNGAGTESYDSYKTWEEVTEPERTFEGNQHTGKLDYSYEETTTDVKVDASVEKDRDVQVKLDQTSVTTVTGETSTSTTTPAPSNPGGSSGSSGSGSSSRPSSRPSTPANPSTPENPSVNIPEEDVPLTNLPNEDVPLTDRPDETPTEQPPVTELPEEDVPLAETPVQARAVSAANTTRISDAQTPLADVPETGDPMLMEAFAAAAAGANALWFSMGKKRRDDVE